MIRYRPISVKIWGDDRFSRLSKPQPNGQTLWLYLLTGPHTTTLPTAFVAGEAGLAEALGWSLQSFRKVFSEVLREGLIEVDRQTRIVFIPKAVRHNPPQSPNVVVAWRKAFDELPDCRLKQRVFDHTLAELAFIGKGEAFQKAFGNTFIYALPESEQNNTNTRTEHIGKARAKLVETSVPLELVITEEMRTWAHSEGFSDFDITRETPAMIDHFRANGGTKSDWIAAWRNWMRNSRKFAGNKNGAQAPKKTSEQVAEEIRARHGIH